jgi:hypothetical protein
MHGFIWMVRCPNVYSVPRIRSDLKINLSFVSRERRAQSLHNRVAAEERRKDAEFNGWLLFQQSNRTLQDSLLYQPRDYELNVCDGNRSATCDHPKRYHEYIDAEKEKAREAKEVDEAQKEKTDDK